MMTLIMFRHFSYFINLLAYASKRSCIVDDFLLNESEDAERKLKLKMRKK